MTGKLVFSNIPYSCSCGNSLSALCTAPSCKAGRIVLLNLLRGIQEKPSGVLVSLVINARGGVPKGSFNVVGNKLGGIFLPVLRSEWAMGSSGNQVNKIRYFIDGYDLFSEHQTQNNEMLVLYREVREHVSLYDVQKALYSFQAGGCSRALDNCTVGVAHYFSRYIN